MKLRRISSPTNDAVKDAAQLKRKRIRYKRRQFIIEGEDLLEAALKGGFYPRQVFVLKEREGELMVMLSEVAGEAAVLHKDAEVFICSEAVMSKLSALGSGSRVIAVFDFIKESETGLEGIRHAGEKGPLLYLSRTGDPGNVGTLIRTGAAFGARGVAFSEGAADPYSFKALRATMGAIFQIPLYFGVGPEEIISWSRQADFDIVCAHPHEGEPPWEAAGDKEGRLSGGFTLVLGSEREGLPAALMDEADLIIRIPQVPQTESVNVAMAGTVILYEAMRQRQSGLPF